MGIPRNSRVISLSNATSKQKASHSRNGKKKVRTLHFNRSVSSFRYGKDRIKLLNTQGIGRYVSHIEAFIRF